jgi:hypothetical protein
MIMFAGQMVGWLGRELAGHAKVDAQPVVETKTEEHLFSVGLDGAQRLSPQGGAHSGGADTPQNPFLVVQVDAQNLLIQRRGPAAAEIKNLGKFRHQRRVGSVGENSKLGWGQGSDILSGWRQS